MKDFAVKVLTAQIAPGSVGVFFLGQAGFILKTPAGKLIAVDPYLSNCCERCFGFKRLMPQILGPDELTFERLLLSHAHYDHFDPDSIPMLMSGGHTEMIGAKDIAKECERLKLKNNITLLACGETVQRGKAGKKGKHDGNSHLFASEPFHLHQPQTTRSAPSIGEYDACRTAHTCSSHIPAPLFGRESLFLSEHEFSHQPTSKRPKGKADNMICAEIWLSERYRLGSLMLCIKLWQTATQASLTGKAIAVCICFLRIHFAFRKMNSLPGFSE